MIRLTEILEDASSWEATLTLAYDDRVKSRQRVALDDGRAAGLFLPRGTILHQGDRLSSEGGLVVAVRAASEPVSTVHSDDALLLARVCYHLGNRHVPLQIAAGWVRYQEDHVLDDMVRGLGLAVAHEKAPFQPEGGAYGGGHRHH